MIWTSSSSGELSAKQAYLFLWHPSPSLDWGKKLWSKFILPRMSLHAWKVLRGRVMPDDFLQRRGEVLVSRCNLCGASTESLDHVFLHCSFSAAIWNHFSSFFEFPVLPISILDVLLMGINNGRSPQIKELWLICFTSDLWFLWHTRNKIRFDGRSFSIVAVCRLISGHILAASRPATGIVHNTSQALRVLNCFGADCRWRRAPNVVEVFWHPPTIGWVKINANGAWKHAEGVGGYGAVFRDFRGHFLGAFAANIDIPSSIAAEVMAVIMTIELAWVSDGNTSG